jgi:pyridoxal phosphate enzyme (YggS family)
MNFLQLTAKIRDAGVLLVAVSKTKPNSRILELYQSGQRDFGENRVQELIAKYETLPKDIRWHMIGRLQRNKVKFIVPFVGLIHSVDNLALLEEIEKQAAKIDRKVDCLLQFHIAKETTKAGFYAQEINNWSTETFSAFPHVQICGIMGMATFTEDKEIIRAEFQALREIFEHLKTGLFERNPAFRELSMGMSDDYEIAIETGSTIVRIGTLLFGLR